MKKRNIKRKGLSDYKWMIILLIIYVFLTFLLTILYQYVPIIFEHGLFGEASFYASIITGMYNSIIDFVILTIILSVMLERNKKKEMIRGYQEEIDNCRFWQDKEAAYRIRALILRLQENQVYKVNLSKCFMKAVIMKNIRLEESELMGADLSEANIEQSEFYSCDFQGAFFENAILRNSYFEGCKLKYLKCRESRLKGIKIINSDLENSDFTNSDMKAAMIKSCNLKKVKFDNANLERANLLGCKNVNPADLAKSKTLKNAHIDEDLREKILKIKPELLQNDYPLDQII